MKILVFCAFLSFVATQKTVEDGKTPFELDEFLKGKFSGKRWNGTWVSDTTYLVKDSEKNTHKVIVSENRTELFLRASVFQNYTGYSISPTPDLKYILIRYDNIAVFRHSARAKYTVYDVEKQNYHHVFMKTHLQLAKWSPDGRGLVFVYGNNIFYLPSPTSADAIKITEDGIPGVIYNGVPDWVYEEEVLGSGSALWFSPDGKHLVFATFDDRAVVDYHYFLYGEPGKISSQYPNLVTLKYPKVGAPNPTVAVKYVNLESSDKVITVLNDIIPRQYVTDDHILQDVTWATNTDVVAVSLNRVQNIAAITRCNVETFACNEIHKIEEGRGWIDLKAPIYRKDGTKFLTIASEHEGNDSFRHLVMVDTNASPKRKRLTFGRKTVIAIYGWDEGRGFIYYVATVENEPSQQHVYSFKLDTNEDQCITCNYQTPEGLCKTASISFSKGFSYYAKICSGPGPTIVQVTSTDTLDYYAWEKNVYIREELLKKIKPIQKDLKVRLQEGFEVRVRLLLPPGLDENAAVKYPMIVNVYAGPNSNRISDAYSFTDVANYFVTNRKYIYAYIDGRGSGKSGDNLLYAVYRKLGTVEIEDQITVTKYLQDNLKYIDAERTGIWGWSYGGFATIWALIKDTGNVFKFGLAVAPVTSFIYYDSIYTERYMGLPTPEDNMEGYNNTDTTRRVEALQNKTLFLIHGNADDNVHYQQSMLLEKALERADIMFYQQSYPDENHSLGGVSPHLYHTIDTFFKYGIQSKKPNKRKHLKSYGRFVNKTQQ